MPFSPHPSPDSPELEVEVFRSGDYGPKGLYSETDLDAMAADYSSSRHEAPVTLDHDQSGPAHGWVRRLTRQGDRLVATIGGLSSQLLQALRESTYKKRSIELYRRFAETGRPYLKALSFLGAAAPEVKGLQDPVFQENGEEVLIFTEEASSPEAEEPRTDWREEARRRLVEARAWRPRFEEQGLLDVLEALGEHPEEYERLISFLEQLDPPQLFQTVEREGDTDAFAEGLVGVSVPERLDAHRRAVELAGRNPELSYREALERIATF